MLTAAYRPSVVLMDAPATGSAVTLLMLFGLIGGVMAIASAKQKLSRRRAG